MRATLVSAAVLLTLSACGLHTERVSRSHSPTAKPTKTTKAWATPQTSWSFEDVKAYENALTSAAKIPGVMSQAEYERNKARARQVLQFKARTNDQLGKLQLNKDIAATSAALSAQLITASNAPKAAKTYEIVESVERLKILTDALEGLPMVTTDTPDRIELIAQTRGSLVRAENALKVLRHAQKKD